VKFLTTKHFNFYILFPNHQEGLHLHRKLKEANVKCTISPTPREASSFCGMSLLIEEENLDMAAKIIKENNIKTEGIVKLEKKPSIWNKTC
jgi:hypothetical protein